VIGGSRSSVDQSVHSAVVEGDQTMLSVACPGCGERGKIPADLAGARIKCKKCGKAFQVAASPEKHPAPVAPAHQGIAVEGLDAEAWSLAPEQPTQAQVVATSEPQAGPSAASEAFTVHHDGPFKEYKLLTSRDKIFEGKFEIARLEEVLNQLARQGWTAKSMCLPHLKNFQGAMAEEIVVLLER
jgi:hypothetical protein